MSGVLVAGGAVAALFASTLAAQSVTAEPEVPSERITVSVNTVNGSGCPAGTAEVAPSPDNTAFTVTYSHYLAQAGDGSGPIDFRKNCQLNVSVDIPTGFTYAIYSADYRGYAYLKDGASGMAQASYYHQGSPSTASAKTEFDGPYNDNWQMTHTAEVGEIIWAPCGETRNLNINSELRVRSNAEGDTSFMAMDSTDGAVNTTFHLAWKEC